MQNPIRQYGIKEPTSFTSLKWSPHTPNLFAVSSAANFGIVGKGSTHIKCLEGNVIKTVASLDQNDAVFDISWFELNDQFLLIGSGSGNISFWNIGKTRVWAIPANSEVHSVQCAYKNPLFIAGCVNGVVHVGNTENAKLMFSIPAHAKNCNQVQWHPHSEKVFASCGADGCLKLWDHTLPKPNISTLRAHDAEVLTLDFHKYEEQIVTGSSDKTLKIWDLRKLDAPINMLAHHRYPPKKVRFSPHVPWLMASSGYDMNVHIYDLRDNLQPLKFKGGQHTEFVPGLDFSMFDEKLIGSVGWDGRILVWDFDQPQPIIT